MANIVQAELCKCYIYHESLIKSYIFHRNEAAVLQVFYCILYLLMSLMY